MTRLQSQLLPRKSFYPRRTPYQTFASHVAAAMEEREREHEQPELTVQARAAEPEFSMADLLLELRGGAV